ncbi:hypothetical protein KR054_006994, partial [Drosophila jambulina]
MAPKKRISRIPSRASVPELVSTNGSGRSIGTQTDPEVNRGQFAPQPSKRQKILEKIKQLNKAKKPEMSSSSSLASSSSSSSSVLSLLKAVDLCPNAFVPGKNEKACQVMESELDAVPFCPKSDFANKMKDLKSEVDRRRVESIIWDINRLDTLDELINNDPPPRWAAACEMWLEVDQLEARIEAFSKE